MGQQKVWQGVLGIVGKKLVKVERKGQIKKNQRRRRGNRRK